MKKELEEQRAEKQRTAMESALRTFGRRLLDTSEPANPETVETILESAFDKVGELIDITWQPDGCTVLLEPWEEKRLRKETEGTIPAIFEAIIDDNLNLASYRKLEDPDILRQIRNDMVLKEIISSFRKSLVQDIHAFENTVAEGGRIIQLNEVINEGWKVKFEPWEEMRKRNIGRNGRPPVVTYVIKTDKDFNDISCEKI